MKLLYITNGVNGPGGLERVLSVKTSILADKYGYDIIILSWNEQYKKPFYKFSEKIRKIELSLTGNSFKNILKYRRTLRNITNQESPNVISVCDDGLKGFLIPFFLNNINTPIIYERHASIAFNYHSTVKSILTVVKNKIYSYLSRWAARKFDRVVLLTNGSLKNWKQGNLLVIPNPLSFYPSHTSDLSSKRIIAIGGPSYNKGFDLLFKSWSNIIEFYPGWNLSIFGKKGNKQKFETIAKQVGLHSNFEINDPTTEIINEYLKSSILVVSSRSEGFGMVIIEAMACGLPCVSFNCPDGPADIINDGVDGFLVENGNTEELSEKITTLIKDPLLRNQMGQKARQNVLRYSPENIIEQWHALFTELAG